MKTDNAHWRSFDRQHIWRPYAPLPGNADAWLVRHAEGVELTLDDGRALIDGMASWWSVIHGYNHPRLNQAISDQLEAFAHVMFGGLTHQPAIQLAQRLIDIAPAPLDRVFFADSGSVAVEVAMKMAIQHHAALGQPEKQRFLTVRRGYHGDTCGAMSVCDPENGMHRLFHKALPQQFFAPAPALGASDDDADIAAFADLLERHHRQIAAVIIEPIVQGAGGMRIYRPAYLSAVADLCQTHNVLLIADEIATGFGRTGALFACEHASVTPDILCLGKALTGGYLSLAAVLTHREIAETVSASEAGALMHGPTFMANPLACAVANASIDLLLAQDWREKVGNIEKQLIAELEPCRQLPTVRDVRCKGAIGVVEMKSPKDIEGLQPRFVELGVWIRPFSNLVYIMPPYIIETEQITRLTSAIHQVLSEKA
ncbi:MAG TPA: adenosylmethionine--8-amino-7-oxononanoate transaminase [Gammaproteobacteria bacterium]|nr:adenosylmethionine--8-amino-7-oxononanoate transaminase [Gammaproteobacteria bacterium]